MRMLGQFMTGGCACCGGQNSDRRRQRRIEQREFRRSLLPATDLAWLGSIDPHYDLSDCQHGCNGSPCNGERCTFMCHREEE